MVMQSRRYATVELPFEGPPDSIPADRIPVAVTFAHESGVGVEVPGFWDGARRYLVRFCPHLSGQWTWTSTSTAAAELHGLRGRIDVGPAAAGDHGPVRVAATFHFAHDDGRPFRPVGTTVYNWLHQRDPLGDQTVEAIAAAGFTKLRFMVFPQAGDYADHTPERLPFARTPAGRWDVSRPDVDFYRRLDDTVRALAGHGIQSDILILSAYDNERYGLDRLTEAEEEVYLAYLVARLSGFPTIWWSLCNEYDLLGRPDDRWTRLGRWLAEIDPHRHLRSIHNWVRLYDHNQDWVTHASIQLGQATTELGRAGLLRDVYRKPVVLDEIRYEGDIPLRWGRQSGRELVHQFWVATVSGCYASHGESFERPGGSLHVVEGGPLIGESPSRLGFLRRLLDEVDGPGLDPIDNWWDDAFVAGIPGRVYLQYLGRAAPTAWSFRIPRRAGDSVSAGDRFAVDVIDTWEMTVTPLATVFTIDEIHRNDAYDRRSPAVHLPAGHAIAIRVRALP